MVAHDLLQAYHAFERGQSWMSTNRTMSAFLFILLAVLIIGGNAMILLRTAKKPKIPDSVKSLPRDEEDAGW